MKKLLAMKKLLLILSISLFAIQIGFTQTNVSGGIYSNTTWTLSNSPYIVVDTVVVFPGVTLTIEPGVEVKFEDNMRLEVRQAKIMANGTIVDSIFFTSNSTSPTSGIWGDIFINECTDTIEFNYCSFKYADYGIKIIFSNINVIVKNSNFINNNNGIYNDPYTSQFHLTLDSTNFVSNTYYGVYGSAEGSTINDCRFTNNQYGIELYGYITTKNCTIDFNQTGLGVHGLVENCLIENNQIGVAHGEGKVINCKIFNNSITGFYTAGDTIINCQIKYNEIGFHDWEEHDPNVLTNNIIDSNTIGIKLENNLSGGTKAYCNKICNNLNYNVYNNQSFGSNSDVSDNYWCTTDSAIISASIYDGYDNVSLSLLSFIPLDTTNCYLMTEINNPIENKINTKLLVYPNPTTGLLTIKNEKYRIKNVSVFDIYGKEVLSQDVTLRHSKCELDLSTQPKGIYIIKVQTSKGVAVEKVVLE